MSMREEGLNTLLGKLGVHLAAIDDALSLWSGTRVQATIISRGPDGMYIALIAPDKAMRLVKTTDIVHADGVVAVIDVGPDGNPTGIELAWDENQA